MSFWQRLLWFFGLDFIRQAEREIQADEDSAARQAAWTTLLSGDH